MTKKKGLTTDSSGHSPYSPSKMEMLERCPCFWQDPTIDSEAAQRGTRLHEAVENDDPERVADTEDREQVLTCMMHKQQLIQKFPNAQVHNELKVESSFNHGTADLVLLDFETGEAVVLDYKFGKEKVTAPDRNLQLWCYGYAVMSDYAEINKVHLYVSQPQCGDDMEFATLERSDIQMIRSRMEQVIARTEDPNAQPTPSDKSCNYCDKMGDCPAIRQISLKPFTQHYGLVVPENVQLGIDYGAKTVGQVYAFAALLEDFSKQLKKETALQAEALSKQGQKIEGATLVHRKGNLKVMDKEELLNSLVTKLSRRDILLNCCNISAKKVSELLKDTCGDDPIKFIETMETEGIFERGKPSIFLKKRSPKVDLKQMLKGEL